MSRQPKHAYRKARQLTWLRGACIVLLVACPLAASAAYPESHSADSHQAPADETSVKTPKDRAGQLVSLLHSRRLGQEHASTSTEHAAPPRPGPIALKARKDVAALGGTACELFSNDACARLISDRPAKVLPPSWPENTTRLYQLLDSRIRSRVAARQMPIGATLEARSGTRTGASSDLLIAASYGAAAVVCMAPVLTEVCGAIASTF